ncbi:hypothetical protein [Staphylococcus haemolyticus]|uniref:hypothetical protein n=1 Tax=Staphylococcus haemolyticus TaxID=1283 RepID=UPI000E3C6E27|nr:hypothetical protein [Staphylococcus haemolyticus]RFT97541.1 hypothetical protein DT249_04265 [Staphylococcus haemolyticus]RFU02713.1 hypothetical protein DT248_04660 [Staphylococcus haemolyticus]
MHFSNEDLKECLEAFKEGYIQTLEEDLDFLNKKDWKDFPFYRALEYLGIKIFNVESLDTLNDHVILITNNIENEYKYIEIKDNPDIKRRMYDIKNKFERETTIIKEFYLTGIDLNKKIAPHIDSQLLFNNSPKFFKKYGKKVCEGHYESIKHNKNQPITKNDKPKINPFSFLDFDALIKKVNDEDFDYQMNEAKICYEQQLYLAACCTFSVCLETVLMQILEKHNLKVNEDSTMLNKIGETLRENKIISKRANNRLLTTYSVRNSTSHTNKNKVIQNDCEWILKTIEFFVDEYLND